MQHTKHLTLPFVQQKVLSASRKDAMASVVLQAISENKVEVVIEEKKEEIQEKVVELVEQKSEEIAEKIEEQTDKVLDAVQEKTQEVAEKVEEAVEKAAKPLTDLIDKLDDDPRVKAVIDNVTEGIVQQVDGREFSCFCFGLFWSLRISRKRPQSSQPKEEVLEKIDIAPRPQDAPTLELPQTKAQPESQ